MRLGAEADDLYCGDAACKHFIDGGSPLFGDCKAERLSQNRQRGVHAPDGIPHRHGQTHRIAALLLAPHIADHIIVKAGAGICRRRRNNLHHVRHLVLRDIRDIRILRKGDLLQAYQNQRDRKTAQATLGHHDDSYRLSTIVASG